MNMKKVIASVIAGAVAVSAMATAAFADTESVLKTYKSEKSYEGVATFTGIVTSHTEKVVLDIDSAFASSEKVEVTALKFNSTEVKGEDNFKLYAPINDTKTTITVNPLLLKDGESFTVTIKASGTNALVTAAKDADAKKAVFKDKNITSTSTNLANTRVASAEGKEVSTEKYLDIPEALKDLDDDFAGIDATIAGKIGNAKGAKLIFNIKDTKDDDSSSSSDPSYTQSATFASATAQDLGIMLNKTSKLSTAASIDKDAMTVTFDWDSLLADSNITNAIGEVNTIQIIGKNTLADDRYVIESITVVVPDAAAVTEAPTTEAPADDTTTTPADENPETGAAPVALALIPAALAAVVVAKKRK